MTIGRNDPCHCGSGKKYKRCCLEKDSGTGSLYKIFMVVGILIFVASLILVFNSVREFEPGSSNRVWSEEHQHYH